MAAKRANDKNNEPEPTARQRAKKATGRKPGTGKSAEAGKRPAKKAPAKKASTGKPAGTAKTAAPPRTPATGKQPVAAAAPAQDPVVTTVVASIDAGFGNRLYIRGDGAELSWDSGVPMECVGPDKWRFSTTLAQGGFEVKFLLNDAEWSRGENVSVAAGDELVVEPSF